MDNNENSFWKNTKATVPGRPKTKNHTSGSGGSFQKYRDSVQDAWSTGDDEFTKQFSILTGNFDRKERKFTNFSQ